MAKIIDAEVKGLIEAQRKQEQVIRDLRGAPMLNAMRDATLIVERAAKKNAPVDTGRLRASITPEVRMEKDTITGVVGSNVAYAPYMEFGTKPHFPPLHILAGWVYRKLDLTGWEGVTATWLIALKIAAHGLKARNYLKNAFEDNQERIKKRVGDGVYYILEKK